MAEAIAQDPGAGQLERTPQAVTPAVANAGVQLQRLGDLTRVPWVRQLAFMVGVAGSIALGFATVLWMIEPEYQPITSEFQSFDTATVTGILDGSDIPYKLDVRSGLVLVPSENMARARLKLAEAGAVGDGPAGFEILDEPRSFGTSQFMESARFRQGLEGELGRTIGSINGVRRARVHLAIPRESSFLQSERKASASVTLHMLPGAELSRGQVKAISRLVAGAVPQLDASDVTIVDQNSRLLSANDDESFSEEQLEFRRQREASLQRKIHNVLAPIVGYDRFSAEVSVDLDFAWVEETQERFDPDAGVVLSERTLAEQRVGDRARVGIPGAVSNQPPAVGEAPQTLEEAGVNLLDPRGQQSRSEQLRNFEHNRTISHRRFPVGEVRRQTISVLVDNRLFANDEGVAVSEPWSEDELARMETLVRNAVGFDAERGGGVAVVNSAFFEAIPEPVAEPAPLVRMDDVLLYGGSAATLMLIVLAFRLMSGSRRKSKPTTDFEDSLALPDPQDFDDSMLEGVLDDVVSLGTDGDAKMSNSAVNYARQLEAIRTLIHHDPTRVAEVVKNWVSDE